MPKTEPNIDVFLSLKHSLLAHLYLEEYTAKYPSKNDISLFAWKILHICSRDLLFSSAFPLKWFEHKLWLTYCLRVPLEREWGRDRCSMSLGDVSIKIHKLSVTDCKSGIVQACQYSYSGLCSESVSISAFTARNSFQRENILNINTALFYD